MKKSDLELSRWTCLNERERLDLARGLLDRIPDSFEFSGFQWYGFNEQKYQIALFQYRSSYFALIPGAEVTLGYDEDYPFETSLEQYESWREDWIEGDENTQVELKDFYRFISSFTTPLRTCQFEPMLVEVRLFEVGLKPIEASSSAIQALISEYPQYQNSFEIRNPTEIGYRVNRKPNGSIEAFQIIPITHSQLVEELDRDGFRLPTSDEWEYLCGSGVRSLFRWGNDSPLDATPIDSNLTWNLHRQPNAFGLQIAQNPYLQEIVAEPEIFRGGDGGEAICGGYGWFNFWLPLASAYLHPGGWVNQENGVSGSFARRVYSLKL